MMILTQNELSVISCVVMAEPMDDHTDTMVADDGDADSGLSSMSSSRQESMSSDVSSSTSSGFHSMSDRRSSASSDASWMSADSNLSSVSGTGIIQ